MLNPADSYKKILKSTAVFGSLQVFTIIIGLVRSKVLAVLIGPSGLGVISLLNSTIGIIGNLTNFSISTIAVKEIASSNDESTTHLLAQKVFLVRRLVWFTGFFGLFVTLLGSPFFSQLTFSSGDFSYSFMVLSVVLLINQISIGQISLLRGLRLVDKVAKATILGNLIGLVGSIILYVLFAEEGIVSSLIVISCSNLFASWYFARQINLPDIESWGLRKIFKESQPLLLMGIAISAGALVSNGFVYLLNLFIQKRSGVEFVGLYNAGMAIVNTYVGMIFTSMSVDYLPRLAQVINSKEKVQQVINEQIEIAILLLCPIITIFLVFITPIIQLLYSGEFFKIRNMLLFSILGIIFKTMSWALGYHLVAQSSRRLYILNEFYANLYMFALNVLFYYYVGLSGLGISFLLGYGIYFIHMCYVNNKVYGIQIVGNLTHIVLIHSLFCLLSFTVSFFFDGWLKYVIGLCIIVVSLLYSLQKIKGKGAIPFFSKLNIDK